MNKRVSEEWKKYIKRKRLEMIFETKGHVVDFFYNSDVLIIKEENFDISMKIQNKGKYYDIVSLKNGYPVFIKNGNKKYSLSSFFKLRFSRESENIEKMLREFIKQVKGNG